MDQKAWGNLIDVDHTRRCEEISCKTGTLYWLDKQ